MSDSKPKEEKAVVRRPVEPVAPFNIEAIFRLAIEMEGTAETLEKLMGIRRELNAEAARTAFDDALSQFQRECPLIKKKKFGAKNAYKFAPLDEIVFQVQELLTKHGFSYTVTSQVEPKWVTAVCRVKHSGGHSENSEFKIPIDDRNVMMNDPQKYAGSLTFAKRYAFCNAFGILTCDEDRDLSSKERPKAPPEGKDSIFNEYVPSEEEPPNTQHVTPYTGDPDKFKPSHMEPPEDATRRKALLQVLRKLFGPDVANVETVAVKYFRAVKAEKGKSKGYVLLAEHDTFETCKVDTLEGIVKSFKSWMPKAEKWWSENEGKLL
jgi:hypothetical protein